MELKNDMASWKETLRIVQWNKFKTLEYSKIHLLNNLKISLPSSIAFKTNTAPTTKMAEYQPINRVCFAKFEQIYLYSI